MSRKWLAIAAVALFGLAAWCTYTLGADRREVTQTLTAFLNALAAGEGGGADRYLGLAADQADALASLQLLATASQAAPGLPALERDVRVGWFGLPGTRRASIGLSGSGATARLGFTIRRTAAGWRVTVLPDMLAHPAAYSLNGPDASPSLLIRGRTLAVGGAGLPVGNQVVFAVVIAGQVVFAQPATATPVSRALRLRPGEFLETEREGLLPLAAAAALYDATGPAPVITDSISSGAAGLAVYSWQSAVWGVAATIRLVPDTIRVAINTTDFGGLTHRQVAVSGRAGLTLRDLVAGRSVAIAAGERVTFSRAIVAGHPGVAAADGAGRELLRSAARLVVTAPDDGRITLDSVIRGFAPRRSSPSYRGRLEVAAALPPVTDGLNIINELPLDQYLYSVVPSEMPATYGLEALKAQALAARAYAVASIIGDDYGQLGAHVDDSTSSQVYGNVAEQPASNRAVDETTGRVPAYRGKVADTRFFSTSCGFTANASEVWTGAGGEFPGTAVPYLIAQPQTSQVAALPDEQSVRSFIERRDLDAPEADAPWFRWTVTLTRQELEAVIRANLAARQKAQPGAVLTRDALRDFTDSPLTSDPVGTLKDIKVGKRGAGGNIMMLEIAGNNGTYRVNREYNIRLVVRPFQYLTAQPAISTVLADGSSRANYGILPSAFAVFDIERDAAGAIVRVTISGGGNGHGVGMSQEGARGLAAAGWTCERIIAHYYPGTKIVGLSQVTGR